VIGNNFRHRRHSTGAALGKVALYVLDTFFVKGYPSMPTLCLVEEKTPRPWLRKRARVRLKKLRDGMSQTGKDRDSRNAAVKLQFRNFAADDVVMAGE